MIGGFLLPQSDGGYQSDGEGEPVAVDDAAGGRGQLGEEGVLLGLRPQGVRVPVGDSLAVRPLGLVPLAGLGGAWQIRICAPAPPAVRSASRRSPAPPDRRASPNRVVAAQHGQVRHRLAHLTANDRVRVRQLRITTYSRNVKRWRNGTLVVRWVSASIVEAEKTFRRVHGWCDITKLVSALAVLEAKEEAATEQVA